MLLKKAAGNAVFLTISSSDYFLTATNIPIECRIQLRLMQQSLSFK